MQLEKNTPDLNSPFEIEQKKTMNSEINQRQFNALIKVPCSHESDINMRLARTNQRPTLLSLL